MEDMDKHLYRLLGFLMGMLLGFVVIARLIACWG